MAKKAEDGAAGFEMPESVEVTEKKFIIANNSAVIGYYFINGEQFEVPQHSHVITNQYPQLKTGELTITELK